MTYTYSNTAPSRDVFVRLYNDCKPVLFGETLPVVVCPKPLEYTFSSLNDATYHTQLIKDGKTVCWFAGTVNGNLVDYTVALVSPDKDGSRSYWYTPEFWSNVEAALRSDQLDALKCTIVAGTGLHKNLATIVTGKPTPAVAVASAEATLLPVDTATVTIDWSAE